MHFQTHTIFLLAVVATIAHADANYCQQGSVDETASFLDPVWSLGSFLIGSGWGRPHCNRQGSALHFLLHTPVVKVTTCKALSRFAAVDDVESIHSLISKDFKVYDSSTGAKAVGATKRNEWAEGFDKAEKELQHMHKFRDRHNTLVDEVHEKKMQMDSSYRSKYNQARRESSNINGEVSLYTEKVSPSNDFGDEETSAASKSKGWYIYSPSLDAKGIDRSDTQKLWDWHNQCTKFSTFEWVLYFNPIILPFRFIWWILSGAWYISPWFGGFVGLMCLTPCSLVDFNVVLSDLCGKKRH